MKQTTLFAAVAAAAVCAATLSAHAFAQGSAFPDVPANHWAASSVNALAKAGIVSGYGPSPLAILAAPDKKKPAYDGNKPVTRYELAVTLYRFVQHMDKVAKQPKSATGASVMPKTGADAVKQLIARGYIKANSPFAKNATAAGGIKPVTADEFAAALGDVLSKVQETRTPVTKDSGLDIARPGGDTHTH